jgi:hypothetical protein
VLPVAARRWVLTDNTTDMGIKLIRSSPYYAQANGQAEASNQSLIKLIKRKIDEHPRRWHEVLSEALWAYHVSCHGATKTSSYHLVYGQEAVLPWEITAGSRRVDFQNDLTVEENVALMNDNIEDLTELRLWSLEKIKENKAKVARAYNKKVKPKVFQVRDLVWKAVLPWGLRMQRMANGPQIGMGLMELTKSYLGTHICLRS